MAIDGWRDRREDEYIALNDAQKQSFFIELGHKRHQSTKDAIWDYISNPRLHTGINKELGDFLSRLTWTGDRFLLVARQDAVWDSNWVVSVIKKYF